MSSSYKDKYEILKTFKEDERQNVLIGSNKEASNKVVVINILHKNKVSKLLSKSQIPNGLYNLVHLEENENDLIVITEYKEGTPLNSYLTYFDTTLKHKINLAYEYINKIVKYDIFHNSVKTVLIDESQVNIKNNELYFSELLFLDDKFSEPTSFSAIASKIANVIDKIVFSNIHDEDIDNDIAANKIKDFINNLKNGYYSFNSIESIYEEFRKIYIYDLFMEDEYKLDDDNNEVLQHNIKGDIQEKSLHEKDIYTNLINDNEVSETEVEQEITSISEDDDNSIDSPNETQSGINENNINVNPKEILVSDEEISSKIQEKDENDDDKKKKRNYFPLAIAGGILAVILLFAILHKPKVETFKPDESSLQAKIEAYFEYTKISSDTYYFEDKSKSLGKDNKTTEISWEIYKDDKLVNEIKNKTSLKLRFKNEGEYKIVLLAKDSFGNTDSYNETIFNNKIEIDELKNNTQYEEKLDNLNLTYSNNSIVKDYSAFRSGDYSLKIGEEGKSNSEKITIDKITINDKPIISMWLASSSNQNIKILLKGYTNNILQFQKQVSFKPKEINAWEMVEFSETTKNIDEIEIILKDFTSPIWLDDISISSYK